MIRFKRIERTLNDVLEPKYLEIINESNRHHVPPDSETHFKVIIVSSRFENMTRIERQRLINQLLSEEFNEGLHALTMRLFTEAEWNTKGNKPLTDSPPCRDGFLR